MKILKSAKNFILWIKDNPKKSIVGTVIVGSLGKWIYGKYDDHLFRRASCRDTLHLGTSLIKGQEQPKRIIVFLNPAANGGKAVSLFEKNSAPILHLSGNVVSVVKSEYEGQAKQFMSVLDEADMIVAAGGDGTVNEVVTGLLRRPDYQKWAHIPIGVIPLGRSNSICRLLHPTVSDRPAQWIMNVTSDLLACKTRSMDVMKIDSGSGKPVFALSDIRWGSYRDAVAKTHKYWYFGSLKKYMTYVFASFRNKIRTPRELELSYSNPSVIPEKINYTEVQQRAAATSSLLSKLPSLLMGWWTGQSKKEDAAIEATQVQEVVVEKDNVLFDASGINFKTLEFMVSANTHSPNEERRVASATVSIEDEDFAMSDFIKNGPKRNISGRHISTHLQKQIKVGHLDFKPHNFEDTWFSIDSEDYEAMHCSIEVLPNQLNMIYSDT